MSDDLRLAVLTAMVRRHGPIPTMHVSRVQAFDAEKKPVVRWRVEPSEIREEPGNYLALALRVLVEESPSPGGVLVPVGDLTRKRFEQAGEAWDARNRTCLALGWLPWDESPLGRPLTDRDAGRALDLIEADDDGVRIIPVEWSRKPRKAETPSQGSPADPWASLGVPKSFLDPLKLRLPSDRKD